MWDPFAVTDLVGVAGIFFSAGLLVVVATTVYFVGTYAVRVASGQTDDVLGTDMGTFDGEGLYKHSHGLDYDMDLSDYPDGDDDD